MELEAVLTAVDSGAGVLGLYILYKLHLKALETIDRLAELASERDSEDMST